MHPIYTAQLIRHTISTQININKCFFYLYRLFKKVFMMKRAIFLNNFTGMLGPEQYESEFSAHFQWQFETDKTKKTF